MSRLLIAEISSWNIEYPVNGDYLATALTRNTRGTLWVTK
jgi:hypothetical protein